MPEKSGRDRPEKAKLPIDLYEQKINQKKQESYKYRSVTKN